VIKINKKQKEKFIKTYEEWGIKALKSEITRHGYRIQESLKEFKLLKELYEAKK